MTRSLLFLLATLGTADAAAAEPAHFHAGVVRLSVQDVEPFDALVWYPTNADAASLTAIRVPVLLYRPTSDDFLKAAANAATVAAGRPLPPREITVPDSHFVFIDPCPPDLAAKVAAICQDAPDADRAAIHRRLESEIADFLQRSL
jgi:hypothetical protein